MFVVIKIFRSVVTNIELFIVVIIQVIIWRGLFGFATILRFDRPHLRAQLFNDVFDFTTIQ